MPSENKKLTTGTRTLHKANYAFKLVTVFVGVTFSVIIIVGSMLLTTREVFDRLPQISSFLRVHKNRVSSVAMRDTNISLSAPVLNTSAQMKSPSHVELRERTIDITGAKLLSLTTDMTDRQQPAKVNPSSKDKWRKWMANISKPEGYRHYGKVNGSELFKPRYPGDDRVADMLNYIPEGYNGSTAEKKLILTWSNYMWEHPNFTGCVVNSCTVTTDKRELRKADAVTFHQPSQKSMPMRDHTIPRSQVWIMGQLESPYISSSLSSLRDRFNWTATYRHDSTFPYLYGRTFLYNQSVKTMPQGVNYAAGKTKKIAWFVTNCNVVKNTRLAYARELGQFIQVDIYGGCGKLQCPRSKSDMCFQYLKTDYKFYLAFENANCRDYMTEKLFLNALQHDVVPIVMGAHPDDYRRAAPHHSYIHVDDFDSPEHLASYLHLLDQNDELYNQYFRWKGTGEVLGNPWFLKWCELCALLHAPRPTIVQHDIDTWWNGKGICIGKDSWRKHGYTPSPGIPPVDSIKLKDM